MDALNEQPCASTGHFAAWLPDGGEARGVPDGHLDVVVTDAQQSRRWSWRARRQPTAEAL